VIYDQLKAKRLAALKAALAIADAVAAADRDYTAEERADYEAKMAEAESFLPRMEEAKKQDAMRQQIIDLGGPEDVKASAAGGDANPRLRGKSLGEQFTESSAFQAWLKQVAPNGTISEKSRVGQSPPMEFKSIFKALVTGDSATSAGAFVNPDITGIYEALGRRPLTIRDLNSVSNTTSDTVEYVRQTTKVSQAAPVAESNVTTYSGATGEVSGEKPEASLAFEKVTEVVKTIAVWIPATKRALADASQIRGIIDQELRDDMAEELEDQLIDGDGVGENFTGILATANILTQAWDTDLLTTIRKARTNLRVNGMSVPTAIVMHPNDTETLDLLVDQQGRYYFGGPVNGDTSRVWRIPVVESEAMTEGVGLMGDFRKAVLWDREQATIQVSDSHSDFFIRNMIAILAEMRAAFGVIRPTAFCEVDLLAGS
jgi:HK97 family phage major capsid protein